MIANESIFSRLANLFDGEKFSEDEISASVRYYVKVFLNVRCKDLCYRFNSNVSRGARVGLRQMLGAGGKVIGSSDEVKVGSQIGKGISKVPIYVKIKFAGNKKSTKPLKAHISVQLRKKFNELLKADLGYSSGEEPAGVKLPSEETQHAGLLKIASEGINEEESVKVTSIDDDAEEYMGKTLLAK